MDIEYILLIAFVILLSLLLYFERKKLTVNGKFPWIYFCMYRTKFGLEWMNKTSKKHPKTLNFLFKLGVITGFLGMLLISFELIKVTIQVFTSATKISAVTPVLPFEGKGIFYVPFSYWIISIFIIALVHEFAHGVASRLYKIPVKSSGFAFLGIILPIVPAAFVEPEEKLLPKKKLSEKLAIYAAGPLSNVIFAIVFFLIALFVFQPLHGVISQEDGVSISKILPNTSASFAGLQKDQVLKSLNDKDFKNVEEFVKVLDNLKPNQEITVKTNDNSYKATLGTHPEDSSKSFLGIIPSQSFAPTINPTLYSIFKWFFGLLLILYMLNLGIGLFNLLPLGPLDGGRMFDAVLHEYFSSERAIKIFSGVTAFFVFLIGFHLLNAFFG